MKTIRQRRFLGAALLAAAVLAGCTSAPERPVPVVVEPAEPAGEPQTPPAQAPEQYAAQGLTLRKTTFQALPATRDVDWDRALKAFQTSCTTGMAAQPAWKTACSNAAGIPKGLGRAFFEGNFEPWQVLAVNAQGAASDTGLMTGYFEPILRASRTRHGIYQHPVYGVPKDLIQVDLSSIHPQLKGLRLRGKLVGNKLVPYEDRAGIAQETEDRSAQVICWADDPVEVFFLQIQGSGRVLLDSGELIRIGYADQNGHSYRSLGAWLIENAGLSRSEMSMQRIKQWVREHPERRQELLNANPNFVFFEERKGYSDDQGPVGAQGVPIEPLASVAVDRRFWNLGVPFVTQASQVNPDMAFTRTVIAQDTGGAIKGAIRFDYFWGLGDQAGQRAGSQKSDVRAWVLVPRGNSAAAVLSNP